MAFVPTLEQVLPILAHAKKQVQHLAQSWARLWQLRLRDGLGGGQTKCRKAVGLLHSFENPYYFLV